jgi:SAM-dependent methyltransferase
MSADANRVEREAWNGERGERWVTDPDRRDLVMASVADALLAAAALRPGESVLDVGCGCGATTLLAAGQVGPTGSVHGVDVSGPMLAVARERTAAAAATAHHVTFDLADAQTHALPSHRFDAAISRFGTMFFDDPVAAFANVARALRPGARLCIATWRPLVANAWLTVPGAALLRFGSLPDTSGAGPGMFAQSDPRVVERVLTDAGFRDVEPRPLDVPLRLGADVEEAIAHLIDTGVGRAVLDTVPEPSRPDALAAVAEVLGEIVDADGVILGGGILLTSAVTVG